MSRRVIATLAVAAGATLAAVLPAAPAQARACTINHYCVTNYYSNAAHTTLVGQRIEDCNGTLSYWGTPVGYATFSEEHC